MAGTLESEIYEATVEALRSLAADEAADTYVVSFFVYGDDPRHPTLTVGTNTETQVRRPANSISLGHVHTSTASTVQAVNALLTDCT